MPINKLDRVWAVNGSRIYTPHIPSKITHTNLTGSSTGRTEDGGMFIDWIRRDLTKVTLDYNAMTGNEVAYMKSLMQGQEYDFTFVDFGETRVIHAYTGDCSYSAYNKTLYANEGGMYTDVTFDVVEM